MRKNKSSFFKIISFFISLVLLSNLFPIYALAGNVNALNGGWFTAYYDEGSSFTTSFDNNLSSNELYLLFDNDTISSNRYSQFYIHTDNKSTIELKEKSDVTVKFVFTLTNARNTAPVKGTCYLTDTSYVNQGYGTVNIQHSYDDAGFDKYTVTCSFNDLKAGSYWFFLYLPNPMYGGVSNVVPSWNIYKNHLTYTAVSEQSSFFKNIIDKLTSWFTSLFDWLSDIVKNIKNGFMNLTSSISSFFSNLTSNLQSWFKNVGDWFSDLGDNLSSWFTNLTNSISGFFTNLVNNLKAWFNNVGQWFVDIGDRISGFFSNLWTNISNRVTEITTNISDWWDNLCEWFRSLFVPEEGYFDAYKNDWETWARAHFGLLYDVSDLVTDIVSMLNFGDYEAGEGSIVIPKITLPFFDNPVIVPKTTFSFSALINEHTYIKYIYELYKFSVTFFGFLLIFKYGLNTFNKLIGESD